MSVFRYSGLWRRVFARSLYGPMAKSLEFIKLALNQYLFLHAHSIDRFGKQINVLEQTSVNGCFHAKRGFTLLILSF